MSFFDCIILDFDGTFTEVDAEATPFIAAFQAGLSRVLEQDIAAPWRSAEARILAAPAAHGWENDGHIVAPSHADPYILCTSVAQLLLEDLKPGLETESRSEILQSLFKQCYPLADTVFRPEAREVVSSILALPQPTYVVTNSHSESVRSKLRDLAPTGLDRLGLCGDAKKFVLGDPVPNDERYQRVPETMELDGLARRIRLDRGHYYEVLRSIWRETGAAPERTLVVGDIFELDLALPSALGTAVHLVTRPSTADYERHAAIGANRGGASPTLGAVLDRLAAG